MSKKQNSKSFSFNDFVEQLKFEAINTPVVVDSKEERKYFLIVCEGEKTEPLYFEYFKKFLPKELLSTVEILGEGDNTLNIVKKAEEICEKRKKNTVLPDFDEVWAVFDKDDFPNQNFDNAILYANQKGIECAYSNQSFELWYVLHFDNLQTCIHRHDYISILSKRLGYKYEKNDIKVVEHLNIKCDVNRAIEWARKLDEFHISNGTTPSNSCPVTRVYKLVEVLRKYCQ